MSRLIGVLSGKGGVGKTTLVSNLGYALTELGHNVTLVDANLQDVFEEYPLFYLLGSPC